MTEKLSKLVEDAREFGDPSMKKLNQMNVKDIFKFMEEYLSDIDEATCTDVFKSGSKHYSVHYNSALEIEDINFNINFYDCINVRIDVLGINVTFKGEHQNNRVLSRLSWKFLKDLIFKQ
jgi:hypothetical protein